MKPLEACQLYTFVDTAYLVGRDPVDIARQLCDGGSDLIQIRAKNLAADEVRRMAERVVPVVRQAGVGLVINDHWAVAAEVGADFCHLGQEDFFDAGHRRSSDLFASGVRPRLGLSSHAPEQARMALEAGADYIAIGPVYATGTKPGARPVTLDYVRWARRHVAVPWFAIGGINLDTLESVLEAGAERVCVVSALLNTANIRAACETLRRRLPPLSESPRQDAPRC